MLFKDITIIDENYEEQKHMNVLVEGKSIKYIGKEIPKDYRGEVYDGKNKVLAPGFFNIHCHIPMGILRGYGDGLPLQKWLFEKMFPYEDRLTEEDCYWAGKLGAIELIKSGVVSFTDMYLNIENIITGIKESGLKGNISHGISAFTEFKDYKEIKGFKDTIRLYEKYKDIADDTIKIDVGLHAEYTSNGDLVREVAAYAKEKNLRVHTHVSETKKEHEECKMRHGMTPTAYFEKNGLLDQPLTAAHCVWIEGEDFDILKEKDVTVAHCISSNLKLGSGFAPIKEMMEKGIKVGFGTDGASSNNNLNMLEEMHLASMANKGINHNPQFMTNQEAFKMATLNGAMSQGRMDTGSIKEGNRADLIVFDFDKAHLQPVHDVLSSIMFSAQSQDICLNMIDGKVVYKDNELTSLDRERIIYEVKSINKRILTEL
ncbi:MAG: amidohydrolase [Tissierella sp.]|uniref:amidohydrolase n=1 Tax=Tissierella sp. TaxID=41274 RepID=UPI003F94FC10